MICREIVNTIVLTMSQQNTKYSIQNILVTFSSLIAYTNYCMAVGVTASSLNVLSYGTVSSIPIILNCLVTNNSGTFLLWSTK